MTQEPRDRAVRAALALLHQPSAADAAEAWHVVGKLGRIGAELRGAVEDATGPGQSPGPWPNAARELIERLEEAAIWWTGRSGFPWSTWDESSAVTLGSLLCELDALATTLLTAAGSGLALHSARTAGVAVVGHGDGGRDPVHGFGQARPADGRRRGLPAGGRLISSIAFAAAAVVGVLGGITIGATQASPAELPKRSIMSEPVPYTLHDGEPSTTAPGPAEASRPATTHAAAPQPRAASQNSAAAPASPIAGSPSVAGRSVTTTSAAPTPQQGSRIPQPRDAGAPPPALTTLPGQDQLDGVVSGIGSQAERVQEEQLLALAERMRAAIGLAPGFRTR